MLTRSLSRLSLAHLPTPLEELTRLQAALQEEGLNPPRLLIKRDDQTGLATGGNKTRKLEFLLADAQEQDADVIITTGAAQSNHCRQTAAAAACLGMRCILVLSGEPPRPWHGNLFLDMLFGAEFEWVTTPAERPARMEALAAELRQQGHTPYTIPTGGSVVLGAASYVAAVEEVQEQLRLMTIKPTHMIVTAGSGGTQAGLLAGVRALGMRTAVIGKNNFAVPDVRDVITRIFMDTHRLLNLQFTPRPESVVVEDAGDYAYGILTDAERETIQLLARTEGLLLDPVYTGRTVAHLLQDIRAGVYDRQHTLLIWHTGGVAGLFACATDWPHPE